MNSKNKNKKGLTYKSQPGVTVINLLLSNCLVESTASVTINNYGLAAPKQLNRVTAYRSVILWG